MYCKNLGLTRGSWTRQCRQFLVPVTAARANATGARSALLAVAVRQTPMPSCAQVRTGLPELMPSVGVVSSLKKRSARNVLQQRVRIVSYLNETVVASLKRDAADIDTQVLRCLVGSCHDQAGGFSRSVKNDKPTDRYDPSNP